MTPVLKSLPSFLLALLMLALTTVGGTGGLAHCAGDGASHQHPSCCLESNHGDHPRDDSGFDREPNPAGLFHDCGCPPGHHHPVACFDMIPLVRGQQAPLVLVEKNTFPSPPDFNPCLMAAGQLPRLPDRIPPADPPPHLTCGPMLI